ncbi:MAG: aspartate 1-decarboxylase [Bryobacteraceae bacterium]
MTIKVLKCKLHRARVTKADIDYEGSISIDPSLMQACGICPNEAVLVWNISNGERFETYAIVGEEPGEIGLNGAAARLVQKGDLIIVAAFCWLDADEAGGHTPRIVLIEGDNQKWVVKS